MIISIMFSEEYKLWSSPFYAVFSSLVSFRPFWVFSAPCSQRPSVCVLILMSETKFDTHTNV
jgi:hypothetical protein